jgi:16S rRNA (cytidine1402-2'-O)-methyltransferase
MRRPDPAELDWLLSPYAVGGEVAAGWRLARARLDEQGRLRVTVAGPTAEVVLTPRDTSPCFAQSRRFNLQLQPGEGGRITSSELQQVLQRVAQVVQRNDAQPAPVEERAAVAVPTSSQLAAGNVLWLVPGHLGDPEDLTLRALRVLRLAARVVVEPGKALRARQLLAGVGVVRPAAAFVELGDDDATAAQLLAEAALAGHDVALFGVDEGVPCLGDPGRVLVAAAHTAGWQVCSVGGPSALGTALMRLPEAIGGFEFMAIGDYQHAGIRAWAARPERALVCYTTPGQLQRLANDWKDLPAVRATLLLRLTQPGERVLHASLDHHGWQGLDAEADAPAVVVLRQK